MSNELEIFNRITELVSQEKGVILGKMMSSPGLKFNDKVFAFFHQKNMVFKLESSKILDDLGISYDLLNPFKTKPPLKGWFVVNSLFTDNWEMLTKEALELMKTKFRI